MEYSLDNLVTKSHKSSKLPHTIDSEKPKKSKKVQNSKVLREKTNIFDLKEKKRTKEENEEMLFNISDDTELDNVSFLENV